MHTRKNFDDDDPALDALEAQWMAEMAGPDRVVAGQALASLFQVYNGLVVRRLGQKEIHPDQVEDIAQQVWIEVSRAAPRYPADIPVRVFIFRYMEYGRRRYWSDRKAAPPLDSLSDELVEATVERTAQALAHVPVNGSDYLAFAHCVRKAFADFGQAHPRLARLLFMRHVEEWSLAEIASAQGGQPDAIKGELFSARGKLKPRVQHCLKLWPQWGVGT